MPRLFRSFVCGLTALSLTAGQVSAAVQAGQTITRADYEACQARDEESFRSAIEAITVKALKAGLSNVDYDAVVADQWRRQGLDEIVDKRVDIAVAEVREETSWGGLIRSLADKAKAQELATEVAERVYRSDTMKAGIESLAVGVGQEVGKSIEFASQDAAAPALKCLKAFLGPRYGATVARTVVNDAGREFGLKPGAGGAEVSAGSVLSESSAGLTGAAILLVRRQLANMARRVGARIVGTVLSRIVSVVAGGIGVVLIAKDLWDLRHGVLPIIATEMKSKSTKDQVKVELAKSLQEQISAQVEVIGAKTAGHVIDIWREYRNAHTLALNLAQRDDGFREFLNRIQPDQMARLDEVVALVQAEEGKEGVLKRLNDGTLSVAVNTLPEDAMIIARDTGSLQNALMWRALAGTETNRIVELGIYKHAKPDDFSRSSLDRVLAVGDPLAITRLASVERKAREALFDVDTNELKSLARSLTESELTTLARYLTGLAREPREKVLRVVAQSPGRMQVLSSGRVRDAVIASDDQLAAVTMMLRADKAFDPEATYNDLQLAWDGRISPMLIWDKHPIVIGATLLAALIVLLLLKRLISPARRRAKPAAKSAAKPNNPDGTVSAGS